jgi:ferredoxin
MPQVEIQGIKTIEVADGRRLVTAIEDAGVDILHRCGGLAKCTTCRVELIDGDAGEMTNAERERLAREDQLEPDIRLSCQIMCTSDLTVRVINRLSETDLSDAGPRPSEELEPKPE